MYCAWRIPAHLRCTQCSILLHLMDICFLTCICLWQISQIQTFLFRVVGPGLVSTSPAFVSASHPAGPHGRHAQKTVNRAPTNINPKNLELAPPQSVTATRLDQLVYRPNYCIQIFRLSLLPAVRIESSTARSKLKSNELTDCAMGISKHGRNHRKKFNRSFNK